MIPNPNLTSTPKITAQLRRRLLAAAAAGSIVFTACGGGDDSPAADGSQSDLPNDAGDIDTGDLTETDGLDTDGLDDGQLEILDDVAEGLEDEFSDGDGDESTAPWSNVRLLTSSGNVRSEALDAEAFSGVTELYSTPIPEPLGNMEFGFRLVDNSVVVDDAVWVSAKTALHRVSLSDGTVTATIPVGDVLAGGEFGDITGDASGVYAVAAMPGGGSFVAEVDPTAGTLRNSIDFTEPTIGLLTIASNDTHVAAAYDNAPGIPVQLIERATGTTTEIGNYLDLHEVHFVRDELWVVIGSGKTTEPSSYEKYSLDGSLIGEGTLPRVGNLRVFADRAVVIEASNQADPGAPVAPLEVEPVGTPIEALLPDGIVTLTAYAEIDGYAISSSSCCLRDEFDSGFNTAVIDMSNGEVVHTADSVQATAILPAAEPADG